jgi:hypothetical protein
VQLLPASFELRPAGLGRPLAEAVQRKMQTLLGVDFSDVRIHEGPEASRLGALAFTIGSEIFFAPGQYNPAHAHGERLLGHELAHVVQQRSGRVHNPFGHGIAVVQMPHLEMEAERIALQMSMKQSLTQRKASPAWQSGRPHGVGLIQPRVIQCELKPVPVEIGHGESQLAIAARKKSEDPKLRKNWAIAQGYKGKDKIISPIFSASSSPGASALLHAEREAIKQLCLWTGASYYQNDGKATAQSLRAQGVKNIAKWYTELPPCPSCDTWCRNFAGEYLSDVVIAYSDQLQDYFLKSEYQKTKYFDEYLADALK